MSKDRTQLTMFTYEDLPLFSGTAPEAKADTFTPKAADRQGLLAKCPICLDTGSVDGKPCWCQANGKEQVGKAHPDPAGHHVESSRPMKIEKRYTDEDFWSEFDETLAVACLSQHYAEPEKIIADMKADAERKSPEPGMEIRTPYALYRAIA